MPPERNYMLRLTFNILLVLVFAATCKAQSTGKTATPKTSLGSSVQAAKFTPAYAEVLLRKIERESELEEFLLGYTEEFPKVKEIRFELSLLQKEMDKITTVKASEAGKLTLALGKLIVRKIELETDLWNLRLQYKDDHDEVKRAKRKVEIYERAIKEIL